MTQVYVENVTLEELIRISDCIIVAKKSNPFTIIERIGITPLGKTPNKITYPDFTKVTYNFEVVKVMYLQQDDQDSMERSLAVGKILIVRPAAQDVAFEMHKQFYLDGLGKSWAERAYQTSAKFNEEDVLILFLDHQGQDNYSFSVSDAYETLDRENAIVAMLNRIRPGPSD